MALTQVALPPLAIPTRTRSSSKYPTTPLSVFPPPAPSIRHPMRDRRGVTLTLQIEAPFNANVNVIPPGPWSPKGHVQPHRSNLPRRRNPKPRFQNFNPEALVRQKSAPKPETPAIPIPTPNPPRADEPHLQAIIPALWVAFSDRSKASSSWAYEEDFTHVVEMTYAAEEAHAPDGAERCWDPELKAQRLRLVLPETARVREGRAALALTDAQLRAARDFLGESLPQTLAAMPEQSTVRVLVTAPPGRPTDAMCVLGCYLSFVAGRGAEEILRCIDEEDSILSVWKGEVSGEEVERIEKIARGWSWLTTVASRQ
ncbi:hypothetical protein DICSQDRAFT_62391 [Dichomitus squalens LYAD-421 SS1]|uniref:Uncharacterized protein n=1 Tax=Dichomitus squalens (strain LYAD-421) TaxID=732165 RepID=R7SYC3_DICSQ|nr:uncharacterized protein DICSQDRAFT_62391 [Dichomitus squalens LYAD-421 SS1]EJF60705.1 hypothetical protein DICSQDRAFT_62391 [Dichomitus squalens LYAD-421 SS1]